MYFKPHKLYIRSASPTERDDNEDPIASSKSEEWQYLCDCFCHDVSIATKSGYTGKGIEPNHYINMDKRDDLKMTIEVEIKDKKDDNLIASGSIVDLKHTSGHTSNYTTIYIR